MEAAVNRLSQWTSLGEVGDVLRGLWGRLAEEQLAAHGPALSTLRRLNLLVLTRGARQAQRAAGVVEALAGTHPARTIILTEQVPGDRLREARDFEGLGGPAARVTVCCFPQKLEDADGLRTAVVPQAVGAGLEASACYEEVLIPARTEDAPLLQSFVEPLLLGELPVALWVPQEPDCTAQDFRRIAALADRMVLDSAAFADPVRGLRLMSHLILEVGGRTTLGDFSWARLTPWLEMVADLFEDPDYRSMLDRLETVVVSYGSEVVDSELLAGGEERLGPAVSRALLFCGWLATRLGWILVGHGWRREGEAAILEMWRAGVGNTPGGTVSIRLQPHRCLPGEFGGLETITLEAGASAVGEVASTITIRRTPETGVCSSHLRAGDREVELRTMYMPLPSEEALLVEELEHDAADTLFQQALAMAAALSALPGSRNLQV